MKFKKIDLTDLESILISLKKGNSKLYVWYCKNDSILKAEVLLKNYNKTRKEIICKPLEGSIFYLQDMINGMGKLNFYIPERSIYFISELKKFNDDLIILWPNELYHYERRESSRAIDFSDVIEINFEFDGKTYRRNCFDIGVGGMSFVLASSEIYNFKEGDVIPFINLKINKELIEISAQIESIDKIDPQINKRYIYKVTRVSLRFIQPDQNMLNVINNLIKNHLP